MTTFTPGSNYTQIRGINQYYDWKKVQKSNIYINVFKPNLILKSIQQNIILHKDRVTEKQTGSVIPCQTPLNTSSAGFLSRQVSHGRYAMLVGPHKLNTGQDSMHPKHQPVTLFSLTINITHKRLKTNMKNDKITGKSKRKTAQTLSIKTLKLQNYM